MTKHFFFKHEGTEKGIPVGPLYVIDENGESNYKDGQPSWDGEHFAEWFLLPRAVQIAKAAGLTLEES